MLRGRTHVRLSLKEGEVLTVCPRETRWRLAIVRHDADHHMEPIALVCVVEACGRRLWAVRDAT